MIDKKNFIISINLLGKEIDELSYEKEGDNLKIYLKPKYGKFLASDVTIETPKENLQNPNFLKLVGRILARLKKISSADIFWSFIPEEDFSKTQTAPQDINSAIKTIKDYFEMPTLAIFWQETRSPAVVKGSICSENENLLRKIAQKISGELKGKEFSFNLGPQKPAEAIKSFFDLI